MPETPSPAPKSASAPHLSERTPFHWVTDFVTGSAPLFTGDFDADRKFIEHVIDKVLVYETGVIVVQFRQASVFEPIGFASLSEPSHGDLASKREQHLAELRNHKAEAAKHIGREAVEKREVEVHVDEHGPAYVMFTPGSVKRTFGPGKYAESVTNASSPTSGEVALASLRG